MTFTRGWCTLCGEEKHFEELRWQGYPDEWKIGTPLLCTSCLEGVNPLK